MERSRGFGFLISLTLTLSPASVLAEPPREQPYDSYPTGDRFLDGYIENMRRETEYWNAVDERRRLQQSIDDFAHELRMRDLQD